MIILLILDRYDNNMLVACGRSKIEGGVKFDQAEGCGRRASDAYQYLFMSHR